MSNRQKTEKNTSPRIKCVVWDLDNTLWNGTLLENDEVTLRPGIEHVLKTLDSRGVLQSIASRNEHTMAMARLEELGIAEYFLYPQINQSSKSASIRCIKDSINIGADSILFIDDEPYEREEVKFSLPEVFCLDAGDISGLLDLPGVSQAFVTEDSRNRRRMYLNDIQRAEVEKSYEGPKERFLESLDMVLTIAEAQESDLLRAEELTVRTNQLNTTGYTYSYDELKGYIESGRHMLLVASLADKFGSYGTIGLALIEQEQDLWTVKLLLMSCRVMSRGVGSVLINFIRAKARDAGVRLHAEFVENDRNRMMYVTYRFAGFKELNLSGVERILENDLTEIPAVPKYMKVLWAER